MWSQVYNPFGNAALSTLAAAIPVVSLLVLIASGKLQAHIAALIALAVGLLVAIFAFTMPAGLALRAAGFGAISGLFPIGWIILNVIFLYRLTVEKGWFEILQRSIGDITPDRRLQLLLIAFCFGAFFEGASGFGTPVAVTGAILMGLGFSPLAAAGLSLIANTAPVAYGALGAPIAGLSQVTGIDPFILGAMVGRILPIFSLIVPFWLIWAFAGFRGMIQIWPAVLVAGVSFAVPQYVMSNFHGPTLVDIVASLAVAGRVGHVTCHGAGGFAVPRLGSFDSAGLAALGCAQSLRLCLGYTDLQGCGLSGRCLSQISDRWPAQSGAESAAGCGQNQHRGCGVWLQHSHHDRHRHFAGGDHCRDHYALLAGAAGQGLF